MFNKKKRVFHAQSEPLDVEPLLSILIA